MIVNPTEKNIWVINQAWRVKPGWILTKMFFLRVCGLRRSRGPQAWSIKDLVYGFRGNFSRGTQRVVQSGHSLRSSRFLSFFPGEDRTSERKSVRAKEHAWGGQKLGASGEGVFRFLRVSFFSHSLPVSFPSRKFLETPAAQAKAVKIIPSCPFG